MRILIATDAWHPQVNGVVRTLTATAEVLCRHGHHVAILSAQGRRSVPLPRYPEIRLAFLSQSEISRVVDRFRPEAFHIATEAPIGLAVRRWCLTHGMPFTTGFHTRFPEFVAARVPLPGIVRFGYDYLRWFHRPSEAVMAPTPTVVGQLEALRFRKLRVWSRGVDHRQFRPEPRHDYELERPIMVSAGRVAREKGLEDFLALDLPGSKVVIGDGPDRTALQARYPDAFFAGYKFGNELARWLAGADVFVFPSRQDTFGLVMLEAMSCGLPVAGYPVQGPLDVVEQGTSGWLADDLGEAVRHALRLSRTDARAHALKFTWEHTARLFFDNLLPTGRATQQEFAPSQPSGKPASATRQQLQML